MIEHIWYDIDLETIERYQVWKPESVTWAMTVNWAKVNDLVRNHIDDYYQITSGGHRITAMRQQGLRWALGAYPTTSGPPASPSSTGYFT